MMGWQELTLIVVIVLLIFGAKRIPEIARALGKASKEFKNARDEFVSEAKKSAEEPAAQHPVQDAETKKSAAGEPEKHA